jgi:crossover junction endodeoxyribonuclease RusA
MPRSYSKKGSTVETSTVPFLNLEISKAIRIVLTGSPLTVNHLYGHTRTGRKYLTTDGRIRKEAYALEARAQYRGVALSGAVDVDVTLYFPNRRRRDSDNALKTVFDALTGVVLEDDSQIIDHHVHMRYDKEKPRVEIIITPYGEGH